jgi:hypothetical protein
MMRISVMVLTMALTVATTAAHAEGLVLQWMTGNELFDKCSQPPNGSGLYSQCIGYVEGVVDVLNLHRTMDGYSNCIPVNVQASQLRDVAMNYLREHPQDRHLGAAMLTITAFAQAWCPANDQPTVSRIPEQEPPKWRAPVPVKKPGKPLPLDTE